MIATCEKLSDQEQATPTPTQINLAIAAIRRNWSPQERVLRQYIATLRRQSLLRAAASSAA